MDESIKIIRIPVLKIKAAERRASRKVELAAVMRI